MNCLNDYLYAKDIFLTYLMQYTHISRVSGLYSGLVKLQVGAGCLGIRAFVPTSILQLGQKGHYDQALSPIYQVRPYIVARL